MHANPNFLVRQVAGKFVLAPVGEAALQFSGMITINGTGKVLWDLLQQEQTVESLAQALTERYEVSLEQATADVKKFLEPLYPTGAIVE